MNRLTLFLLVLLVVAGASYAAPVLDQAVIAPGGGRCRNGTLVMELTMAEPVVGPTANGGAELEYGYWWKILTVNVGVEPTALPTAFALKHAAPNPFITTTRFAYAIPQGQSVPVFLGIYDLHGRLVRTLVHTQQSAGEYRQTWDGRGENGSPASAGVYFVRFTAGKFARNGRVVLIR